MKKQPLVSSDDRIDRFKQNLSLGKKIGEEETRKDEKVTWDGHTSSVEAATRAARANITLEEQIHQIHKVYYFLWPILQVLNRIS